MAKKKEAIQPISQIKLSNKEFRVLDYLNKHGSIDSDQARADLGDARLSETIRQLRCKGYNIETLRIDTVNRYGEPTWYGRYVLK